MKRQLRAAEGIITTTIFIIFLVYPGLYAAEETLPTPEEIIAKNIEAIGGIKALKKIKNKKIVQIRKIDQMNRTIKNTIYQERPNKFYSITGEGVSSVRNGFNNGFFWEMASSHRPVLQEIENSCTILFDDADVPDVCYKFMKTEGIEQINGKDCYKVINTPENGPERTDYYDKINFMIVKTIVNNKGTYGTHKKETYYEEYKKISGILFPYKEVEFHNGQKWSEITTEKIELNIKMPEDIFDIPEEVKAIMKTEKKAEPRKR